MIENVDNLNIIKNKPVRLEDIIKIERQLEVIPKVFKEILSISNGFSNEDGIVIYGTDEIIERNITFEVKEYAGNYMAIGDDSGGRIFLMKKLISTKEVLIVDSGDMNPNNAELISLDLEKWILDGCKLDGDDETTENPYGK